MERMQIRVLLIEDNPGDALLIRESLRHDVAVTIEWVEQLSEGLERLARGGVDVILLDLMLPDSRGLETIDRVRADRPEVPVVVLTGQEDEDLGLAAVQVGAQDYLVKGVDSAILSRAMRYAIARHRAQRRLEAMTMVDELTGLYNRRGFLSLARQQLAMAQRTLRRSALLFADLDNLKEINDGLGHQGGDAALVETTAILRHVFRKSDILARIGGDEFAVFALETSAGAADAAPDSVPERLDQRLREALELRNRSRPPQYPLSLSIGMTETDPAALVAIEDLLARADALMYEEKRSKKRS